MDDLLYFIFCCFICLDDVHDYPIHKHYNNPTDYKTYYPTKITRQGN